MKFPERISKIKNKEKRSTKKNNFRRACNDYCFDLKINRLSKNINFSKDKNKPKKNYIIPYEFEKINIIKNLHEQSMHKGINILYNLVKESNFWWHSIYNDVNNYRYLFLFFK